jgi:hypothetical protein
MITPEERLDLKKMLKESDAQDNTEYIRRVKHSVKIRNDIRVLDKLTKTLPKEELEIVGKEKASFLYETYPDLFKKIVSEELDLAIMSRLLTVLKLIEDGNVDQHEGSVMVGKILKEMYVDSALKKCKKLDEAQPEPEPEPKIEGKPISWKQWSVLRAKIVEDLSAAGVSIK